MPATLLEPTRTLHVILRGPLSAGGVERERYEVVDTTTWRNVQPLINTRRIEALPYGSTDPVSCECGRQWLNADASAAHKCPQREAQASRRSKSKES